MFFAVYEKELENAIEGRSGTSDTIFEKRLVERCKAGEQSAFSELYRIYFPQVYKWVCYLVGPSAEVEDLCHDVFLVAFRQISSFRCQSRISTWLYSITVYSIKWWRRKRAVQDFFGLGHSEEEVDSFPAREPYNSAEEKEAYEKLFALLDRLPEPQRQAFILYEIEELSGEEGAQRLNVSINTFYARLFHARKKLAKMAEAAQLSERKKIKHNKETKR